MSHRSSIAMFVLLTCGAAAQQAPIVQPRAPGKQSRKIDAAAAKVPGSRPLDADIGFMQGMIMHHSQAVEMTDLMKTRTRNERLLSLGLRISISQTDEIEYMKQWLRERGAPETMSHDMSHMSGMNHDMHDMSMPLMPGMLTPDQMKALAAAKGPAFDHLFLTGMIQHHTGALTMVADLFEIPGAGQDAVLYDFANDIDNTQRAEIEIMQGMLREEK